MPDAHAGSYVGAYFAQVPVSPPTNPTTFHASTTPTQYANGTCYQFLGYTGTNPNDMTKRIFGTAPDASAGDGSYQGNSSGDGINGTMSKCSGAISTSWNWVPAKGQTMTTDPPPTQVIIVQTCGVSAVTGVVGGTWSYSTGLGKSGSGTFNPQVNPASGGGSATDTKYFVMAGGASVTLKPTLSASATASPAPSTTSLNYTATITPVFVTPTGCNSAYQALTGQQITATLSGPPTAWVHSYTWSFTGGTSPNPIKTWNPNGFANDGKTPQQLFPLLPTDLTQTDTTGSGIAVNPISFYDQVGDSKVIAQCAISLKFPDGTTTTVTAQAPPISFALPTAAWTVNTVPPYLPKPIPVIEMPGFYSDNATFMQAYEWWDPIQITDPTGFTGGTGCLAQITTPSFTNTRIPTGTGHATYILKVQQPPGSGTWVAPGTGLDGMFPYPKGLADDGFGHDGTPVYTNYMWDISVLGHSQDVSDLSFDQPDVGDNGGQNWIYANSNCQFNTWLMYMPPQYGSQGHIWVPLQTLSWNWGGTANGSGSIWTITKPAFSPGMPVVTQTPPAWTSVIANFEQHY